MPFPNKRRLVAIGLPGALLCASVHGAQARDLVRLSRTAWGCFNPSFAAIINDPAYPGQSDPAWVAKTREMGDCVTITPRSVWERLTTDRDGFTYVVYRGTTAKPGSFWVPTGLLVPAPPEPAASAPVQPLAAPPVQEAPPKPAPPEPEPPLVQEAHPEPVPSEPAPSPVQEPQTRQAIVTSPVAMPDSASAAVAPAPQGSGGGGGLWLWVLLLGGGFWALTRRGRKKRKAAAAEASAATSRVPPRAAPAPVRSRPPNSRHQPSRPASPPTWCPPGYAVQVAGYRIADGMIYVGSVSSRSGFEDGCVIDPSLEIAPSGMWGKLGHWPSYAGLRPEGRRGYLEWLAAGKRAPDADVGFVFLYFYGLERRLFLEKPSDAEIDRIASEVEQLRQIYARNASFDGYSRRFLEAAALIRGAATVTPDMLRPQPGPMSPAMKITIGREIVAGRPLDGRLASAVLLGLPEFRPNSHLVLEQGLHAFLAVLKTRFRAAFPNGLLVRDRKDSRLALGYRGATSGLAVDLAARAGLEELPDPATLTWTKLLSLGDAVAADIEPYAKMLAFHPEQADCLAALAVCPPELHGTVAIEGRRWLAALAPGAGIPFGELARHAIGATNVKWTRRHRRQVSDVLAAAGLGTEPGPEDNITPMEDDTLVYLFPSTGHCSRAMTVASAAAMTVAFLGRGGTRSLETVAETWLGRVPSRLQLIPEDTARLRARMGWLRDAEFSIARLKNALGDAQPEENEFCAWSAAVAAGASGTVEKSKIARLEKICDALQVPRGLVYSWLHADLGTATAPADEPVEVVSGVDGFDTPIIPPSPVIFVPHAEESPVAARREADRLQREHVRAQTARLSAMLAQAPEDEPLRSTASPAASVTLPVGPTAAKRAEEDMIRRERIRAETAQVSAVLAEVFHEEVAVSSTVIEESEAGSFPGLEAAHSTLVRRLAERTHWSRSDYEDAARALDLMPNGAMEAINEWAWETFDEPLIEDADPVLVRMDLLTGDLGVAE